MNNVINSMNQIMDKRYIEVDMSNMLFDFEKEMLSAIRIPSLLPMNILKMDDKSIMCFNTSGYITLSEVDIVSIEGMCRIIKSFVNAINESEKYLLKGSRHFVNMDMIFINMDKDEIKLVYGNQNSQESSGFADNKVHISFLCELKRIINDNVLNHIVEEIIKGLASKNPRAERVVPLIEDIERKWYCRNLIPSMPFSKKGDNVNSEIRRYH